MKVGFVRTVRDIIFSCIVNSDKVNIDKLPIYALDFLFLKIRAKSIGEMITAVYKCNNQIADPESLDIEPTGADMVDEAEIHRHPVKFKSCDTSFNVFINLNDVVIKFPDEYKDSSVIEISPGIGIKLKSPTFDAFRSISVKDKNLVDITDEYIFACVESIYEGDKLFLPNKDFTFEELTEFIDTFPSSAIDSIATFFRNQPRVNLVLSVQCPKCGVQSIIDLSGLEDFFD